MERPIKESAWKRGWHDTTTAWKSLPFVILDALGCVVIGAVFGWYWALGLFIFAMLCVWIGATASAPIKQRNEARAMLGKMENLRHIGTGDTLKGEDFNVSLLFQYHQGIIHNVVFDHCILRGPCLVAVQGGNTKFEGNGFRGSDNFDDLVIESVEGRRYAGVGIFVQCKFLHCEFENLSWLLPKEIIQKFKTDMGVL